MASPRLSSPSAPGELPPLEPGNHLDQKTFHARYEAMPEDFRAELIGGIVFIPPPGKAAHSRVRAKALPWLAEYEEATPGVEAHGSTTLILGPESEPQPDGCLIITPGRGGQMRLNEDEYLEGVPELAAEVASTTAAIDLHRKRTDYERAGVREYVVVVLRPARVVWWVNRGGTFAELAPGADGVLRSEVFPGLWLDPAALLRLDGARVREVLRQGLATAEHAALVARLAGG